MASIGPQIPPHLLKQSKSKSVGSDDDEEPRNVNIGPQIPVHLLNSNSSSNNEKRTESRMRVYDDDEAEEEEGPCTTVGPSVGPTMPPELLRGSKSNKRREDNGDEADGGIGPSLPPHLRSSRPVAGPSMPPPPSVSSSSSSKLHPHPQPQSKRTLGPSLPTYAPTYDPNSGGLDADEDSDDDDIGPKPLPSGMQHQQPDAVQEFIEREEKRRKLAEEASKPKAPKRDEWMLVPPTSSGLLGNLDPTKLKARQFSRGTPSVAASSSKNDNSLWTETPAERQQRLADEVSGKKRRVTDAPIEEDEGTKTKKRRRKAEEEAIRRGVDDYTRTKRGPALVDQHAGAKKPSSEKEPSGIWDHSRDMGLGGRLMDDEKRGKMLKEAKGLGDRFGSGKSGGFL